MHSNKTKDQFVELRAQGLSLSRIASQLHVSKPTLVKWNHDFEHRLRSLRAIELEALQEKILAVHEEDLARLASHQKAVERELAARKLTAVPTEKLFHLAALLRQQLQKTRAEALLIRQHEAYIPLPERPVWLELAEALRNKANSSFFQRYASAFETPPAPSETEKPQNR